MFVLSLTFVHGSAAGGVHIGVNVSFRQIGSCLRIEEQTGLESMPTGSASLDQVCVVSGLNRNVVSYLGNSDILERSK